MAFSPPVSSPSPLLLLLLYKDRNVSAFRFSLVVCQSYTAKVVLERFILLKKLHPKVSLEGCALHGIEHIESTTKVVLL